MFTRIVVPLDGSAIAEQALPAAQYLAGLTGSEINLLRVIDLAGLHRYGTYGLAVEYAAMAEALATERQRSSDYLDDLSKRLQDEKFTVTTTLVDGAAARAIVELIRSGDLIVMATHGRGGFRRWVLGSVAEDVVRHATIPVLLVRAQATETPVAPKAS